MAEKILIISPVPLFPGHAGNRERIQTICSELMERGYILDFFYTGFREEIEKKHNAFFNGDVLQHNCDTNKVRWSRNPLHRIREILNGFKARTHRWFRYLKDGPESAHFNKSIYEYRNSGKILLLRKQLKNKTYKAVIVNYAPYSFYFDLFDHQTTRIIDTHDRLTDRYKLFSEYNYSPADWHSLRFNDEKLALSKADIVWAITDEENEHFSEMVQNLKTNVYTLTHLMPYEKTIRKNSDNNLIMIGSGNRLNLEGLDWFMEQVWEKMKHYKGDIQFKIAGSICDALEGYVNDERVHLLGRFDSPKEIYSEGDVFINPMQSGTGLKIKTFEALAYGKFVMSTKAGATGLDKLISSGLECSDDPTVWIQKIVSFFENPDQKKEELERAGILISEIYQKNLEVITKSLE